MFYAIQARATVVTDGETAKVSWEPNGTPPRFGMSCKVGGEQGFAVSMPVPIDPRSSAQKDLPLPFEDGAKIRADMAHTTAAQILARGGMILTGIAETGINVVCSTSP